MIARIGGWTEFRRVRGDVANTDPVTIDLIDILDTIDVPIVVVHHDFTIACFNRAAGEVLSLAPSDIGRSPAETSVLASLPDLEVWCAQAIATGAAFRHDFRHEHKSFVVPVLPYTRSDGRITGTVLTFTNVTAFRASIDQAIHEREYTKAILNTVTEPLVVLSPDLRMQTANHAFYAMFQVSREEVQNVPLSEFGDGVFDLPRLHAQVQETLADNREFKPFKIEHVFPEIGCRTIMLSAHPLSFLAHSGHGILLGLQDVTEREQAEAVNARLAAIVESSDDAIVSKDLDGIIRSWNRGAMRLFGYTVEEAVGKPVTILIPPDRYDEEPDILERIRRGERIESYETVRVRKDGSLIDISLTVSPVENADGRIIGASKIARDITERRRAEERQNLLLREINHRVKNLFALASGLVTLSTRSAATPEGLAAAVRERLGALASAHELTLPDLLTGCGRPEKATTLHALLRAMVAPYDEHKDGERVNASGPDVPIRGDAVTGFALLLHEFAANAAKYGALSAPTGHVDVRWSVTEQELVLTWRERGGPALDGPPEVVGFGSLLARGTVERQLGGRLSHDWKPGGLLISLSVPLSSLAS